MKNMWQEWQISFVLYKHSNQSLEQKFIQPYQRGPRQVKHIFTWSVYHSVILMWPPNFAVMDSCVL